MINSRSVVYKTLQQQVQPRMLAILLLVMILMLILAGYLYVLKKPIKTFQQSKQTLFLLKNEVKTGVPLQHNILKFQNQVNQLNRNLHGTGPQLPINQMIAFVIAQLDSIASHHDVKLISIKPGITEKLFTFQVLPFHVELSANYFSLFNWLNELEKELGPIVIKKFSLRKEGSNKQRRMSLTLVSYQFIKQ